MLTIAINIGYVDTAYKKPICRYGYKLGDLQYQVDPTGINFQRSRKARAQILRRTVMFLIAALP